MNPPRALVADSNVVALDEAALAALRASLRGDVLLPGDADYETARLVWNGMIDKHPGLIARCAEGTTTVGLGKGPAGTRSALARQRSAFLCAWKGPVCAMTPGSAVSFGSERVANVTFRGALSC